MSENYLLISKYFILNIIFFDIPANYSKIRIQLYCILEVVGTKTMYKCSVHVQ